MKWLSNVNRDRLYTNVNLALVLLFYLFLRSIFLAYIVPNYWYATSRMEFMPYKTLLSMSCLVVVLIVLRRAQVTGFIYAIVNLLIINLLIPNIILYEYLQFHVGIVLSIVFFILQVILLSKIRWSSIPFPTVTISKRILILTVLTCLMLLPFLLHYKVQLDYRLFLLDSEAITDIRQESIDGASTLVAYLSSWLTKVVVPVLMIYGLYTKSKKVILFCIAVLLYIFLVESMKLVLFSIVILVLFYYIRSYYLKTTVVLAVFMVLLIIGRLYTLSSDNYFIESIVVNRTYFIPGILNEYYFEFFQQKPLWYSHSILSSIHAYPYSLPPSYLIGLEYFGSDLVGANNGLISDGYMNMGYLGVLVNTSAVSMIFAYFNALKPGSRFFGVFFLLVATLLSSALLTTLITHGLIFMLLLSPIVFRETDKFDN